MEENIKLCGKDVEIPRDSFIISDLVEKEELIELGKNDFFWTKKHFIRLILGLSKLYPFSKRKNFYLLVFQLQFTNLYSIWLESKILFQL